MALIDKETIRAEIERRIRSIESCPFIEAEVGAYDKRNGKLMAYRDVLSYLDTLPVQPVEGLEKEIDKYFDGWFNDDEYGQAVMPDCLCASVDDCKDIARHFAEWGAEHLKK